MTELDSRNQIFSPRNGDLKRSFLSFTSSSFQVQFMRAPPSVKEEPFFLKKKNSSTSKTEQIQAKMSDKHDDLLFPAKKGKEKSCCDWERSRFSPVLTVPKYEYSIKKTFPCSLSGNFHFGRGRRKNAKKVRHKEAGTCNLNVLLEVLGARLQG